jgi:hypothetical protein
MDLHRIVGPCVAAVSPWVIASVQISTGYTTAADGKRTPSYAKARDMRVQRQPLQYKDLMQISGLNLNGEKCALYVDGNWKGVSRADQRGGDLITFRDGSVWLVVLPLEDWHMMDGWVKLACVRQT